MEYIVKKDDTLFLIAKAFNTTVDGIKRLNNLTDDKLYIGQKLQVGNVPSDPGNVIRPPQHWMTDDVDEIATFKNVRGSKKMDVKIYLSRAAIFFKSKMGVDERSDTTLRQKIGGVYKGLDTKTIPFFVLPQNTSWSKISDFGIIINTLNWRMSFAIFADWGHAHTKEEETIAIKPTLLIGDIGEGSLALGRRLDINNIKQDGINAFQPDGIIYITFPNSGEGNGILKTAEEIERKGSQLFRDWGGDKHLKKVIKSCYNLNWGER